MSNIQSARSKSERFSVKAKDLTMKLPIDAARQPQQEGGRNRVYALPPDPVQPVQPEPAVPNISWAGLLDKKPREEGFNAVRTRPPLSRSVRHPPTVPDLTSQGSYGIEQSGTGGLSKLSTLVATRNSRSQEFRSADSERRPNERFHDKKTNKEVSTDTLRPSHFNRGLDGFDLQEDEGNKKPVIFVHSLNCSVARSTSVICFLLIL